VVSMPWHFVPQRSPGARLALIKSSAFNDADWAFDSPFTFIGANKSLRASKLQLKSALASMFWIYAAVVVSSSIPTSPALAPFPATAKVVNTAGEPVSAPFGGRAVTKITGKSVIAQCLKL
jgi:hypothetical protein